MSLISDALKKARQEAARQDSLRQTLPYAVGTADPPEQRKLYMPLLAGLGAGCVLAVVVFGIVYLGGWGPFSRLRKEAVQIAETPSPAATPRAGFSAEPAPAPPVIEEKSQPVPTPAPRPTPPAPVQEVQPKPAPVQTLPPPVAETPAARTQPAPVPADEARLAPPPVPTPAPSPVPTVAGPIRAPAPPTPAASTVGLEDGKSYVNEVPIPGGGVVKLNGIAYSPDHPIAVLDGRVVAPGEVVQGFTVLEIQADHVTLQGHGAKVSVSLK
ncbi:MAG TPA: hypothetical protein VGQ28_14795 [Thermoanaerobaculia bacterium]|jgi:hypothetical protein|nr:hypothetical protein [Thermoanaerobaculia bacterium]